MISPRAVVDDLRLDKVSKFVGWVLVGYLYLRFWDALSMSYTYEPGRSEALNMLTQGPLSMNFWLGEILLGIIIPMVILLSDRLRRHWPAHLMAMFLVIGGLVAYRWDTNMVGQLVVSSFMPQEFLPQYTAYIPSIVEIAAGLGIIAYGLLAFTLGVRYLKVVYHEPYEAEEIMSAPVLSPSTD